MDLLAPALTLATLGIGALAAGADALAAVRADAPALTQAVVAAAAPLADMVPQIPVKKVEDWVEYGGPWVIFGLLFLCGLGLPLPEEIPILAAGYFIATGDMGWFPVAALAWCGVIGGDCVLYWFGRRYGLNITRVPLLGKHFTQERILRAERLFERWGIWVVAIGRLISGIRGVMCVAAGAIRYNFVKFLVVDGVAALLSGGLFIGIGYAVGRKFGDFDKAVHIVEPYVELFLTFALFALVLLSGYLYVRHRLRRGVADVALEKAVEFTEKHEPPADPLGTVGATEVVGK